MKCLITGDWHLGLLTHGVQRPDGFNSRMQDLKDVILELANRLSGTADCFIHLGDLFHSNTPTPAAIATAADIFNVITKQFKHCFVIGGNHDYAVTRVNPLEVISKMHGVTCIVTPTRVQVGGKEFAFIPHTNKKDLDAFIAGIDGHPRNNRVLCCHTTFSGALTGAEDFMLAAGVNPISRGIAEIIFSGHIHKPQVLKTKQSEYADVYYPGSPMVLDFSERNEKKIALLYDTVTGNVLDFELYEPRKFIQLETDDVAAWPNLNEAVVKVRVKKSNNGVYDALIKAIKDRGAHSIAGIVVDNDEIVESKKQDVAKIDEKQLMWDFLSQKLGKEAEEGWKMAWEIIASAGVVL